MRQLEFQSDGKTITRQVPESWNELTKTQLLSCIRLLFTSRFPDLLHIQLLQVLLNIKRRLFHSLEDWQLVELKQLTAFLLVENKLTKQLLPIIRLPFLKGWSRFIGPKERFRNLTFLEFIFADTYYLHWLKTQDDEYLNKMLATLYRPKVWFHFIKWRLSSYNGDARQAFNEHLVAARAKKLQHLSFETKMAIATWYRGCRNRMEWQYPNVFSSDNQEQAKGKGGWEPVLRNMAGGKFGDLDKTAKVNIHVILMQMDELIEMARENEARLKQK